MKTTHHGAGVFADADYYEVPKEIHTYSWCPTPDGTGKPTQVHLHFGKAPGPIFVVRFKGPGGLDALIDGLTKHRGDVWGER